MAMNKVHLATVVGIAVAFAAGGSVGMLVGSDRPVERRHRPGFGHGLTRDLNLTGAQKEQMKEIWSAVMSREGRKAAWARRLALKQKRDEAIEALLTDEQRVRYDAILAEHDRAMEDMHQEGRRRIEEAVERTRAILTPEQAKKYDEIRTNRRGGPFPGGGPNGGAFRRGRRGHPESRSSRRKPAESRAPDGTGSDAPRRPAPAAGDVNPPAGPGRSVWAYS